MIELGKVSEETQGQQNLPIDDEGTAPFDRKLQG